MLETTLSNALGNAVIQTFVAVRIELQSATINLLDGSAAITFPVDGSHVTFTGRDPVFGTLAAVAAMGEHIATEAPTLLVTLMPPTASAIGALAAPENQGASVRAWFGVWNPATGVPIGTPELMWSGRFDTAKAVLDQNSQYVEIDTVSAFDRLFAAEEGARLTARWHKSIWPGETGLDYSIDALGEVFWGMDATTSGGGGGGNGGGGGGFGRSVFGNSWQYDR